MINHGVYQQQKTIQRLMGIAPSTSHIRSHLSTPIITPEPVDPLKQALSATKKRIRRLHNRHERLKRRLQRTEFQLQSALRDHDYHDARLALQTKLTKLEPKRPRSSRQISPKEVSHAISADIQRILDLIPPEKRQKVLLAFEQGLSRTPEKGATR